MEETKIYSTDEFKDALIADVLKDVIVSLEERGYNPINQIVGYLMSGDPGYISNHKDARTKIMKFERIELNENNADAYIEAYISDPIVGFERMAILVIPGGGYSGVCSDREGEPIAQAFIPYGYNAFVLHYTVDKKHPFPLSLSR